MTTVRRGQQTALNSVGFVAMSFPKEEWKRRDFKNIFEEQDAFHTTRGLAKECYNGLCGKAGILGTSFVSLCFSPRIHCARPP